MLGVLPIFLAFSDALLDFSFHFVTAVLVFGCMTIPILIYWQLSPPLEADPVITNIPFDAAERFYYPINYQLSNDEEYIESEVTKKDGTKEKKTMKPKFRLAESKKKIQKRIENKSKQDNKMMDAPMISHLDYVIEEGNIEKRDEGSKIQTVSASKQQSVVQKSKSKSKKSLRKASSNEISIQQTQSMEESKE